MKRFFIIAAMAAMFCVVACAPQPEVSAPEVEQSADGDEATKVESNNEKDSGESTESTESTESNDNNGMEGMPTPPVPFIMQPADVRIYVYPYIGNEGGSSISKYTPSNLRFEFRSIYDHNENSEDIVNEPGAFTQSKWCIENANKVESIEEIIKEIDPEKYDSYINIFGFFADSYPIYVYTSLIDIEITADKTLWGVEAGQNLADKFYVDSCDIDILFSYPDCEYIGLLTEKTEPWYEVLGQCMLPSCMTLKPIKPFDEIHDKVNFTFAGSFIGYDKDVFGRGPIEFCYE